MRGSSFSNCIFIKSLRMSYKCTMYFDHIHPNFSTPLILCSFPLSPFTLQDQSVLLCTHACGASTGDSLTNSPTFKGNRLFKNHQLSIALQPERGDREPLSSSCWGGDCLDLVQSSPASQLLWDFEYNSPAASTRRCSAPVLNLCLLHTYAPLPEWTLSPREGIMM